MKKVNIIIISIIIFLYMATIQVNAAGMKVQFTGDTEVEVGKTQTITLKITSDIAIGVLEGTLKWDNNIEDVQISESFNGWTTTYNENTGTFNTFNARGTKDGEVLELSYKLKENSTSGSIQINDIKMSTIDYETINMQGTVEKRLTKKIINNQNDEASTQEFVNYDNRQNTSGNSNGLKNQNQINGLEQKNNYSNQTLPKAGIPKLVLLILAVIVILLIIFFAKRAKLYKDIK